MKIGIKLLAVLICAILTGSCTADHEEPEWTLPIGASMPEFEITLNNGEIVNSASLIGHNTIIVFFNTQCRDCRAELPELQKFYDTLRAEHDRDTILLLIAREENEAAIASYWHDNNLTLPYSPQPDRRIYNLFATTGIPRIFTFSPASILIDYHYTPEAKLYRRRQASPPASHISQC